MKVRRPSSSLCARRVVPSDVLICKKKKMEVSAIGFGGGHAWGNHEPLRALEDIALAAVQELAISPVGGVVVGFRNLQLLACGSRRYAAPVGVPGAGEQTGWRGYARP